MNVVLFAEVTIEQVIGGAERVLRQQALGLGKLGHDVRVIARAPFESAEASLSIGSVSERRYSVKRTSEPAFVWSSVQNSLRVFDLTMQAPPIDVGMIHQSLAGLGPIVFRYGMVNRWIYVCHSLAHEEYITRAERASATHERVRRRLSVRARRWIERMVIRRCHHVIVLSEFMKQQVIATHGITPKSITVVPGAADPVTFYPPHDRNEIRRELKLPESRTIVFTVRNLVPRMGLEHLLDAMTMLGEEQENLLLLIGGEGQLRSRLEEHISSKGLHDAVTLLGFVPEDQLAQVLPGFRFGCDADAATRRVRLGDGRSVSLWYAGHGDAGWSDPRSVEHGRSDICDRRDRRSGSRKNITTRIEAISRSTR